MMTKKINVKKWFVLLLMTACLVMPAMATIDDMRFTRLDTRDGMSNSQVLCIYRDSKGYMWFGTTYGLNRYDGYRFRTYYSYAKDTTTLRNNYVEKIFEAYDGKLWLRQGMSFTVFDPVTEKFDRHPEVILRKFGVESGIERIYIDSDKDFWVKTYGEGFWHINPRNGKKKLYPFGYGPQEFNSDVGVCSFVEDGKDLLVSSFNGDIFCFDREKDVIKWKNDYIRRQGTINSQDCKLRIAPSGNIYVVTMHSTYVKLKGSDKWFHSMQDFLRYMGFDDVSEVESVWDVKFDTQNRMWIATDHHGLFILNVKNKEIRQFLYDKHDDSSISDNTIRMIYPDNLGRMWLGTYTNGVNLYTESSSNFRNLELGNITTICVDAKGHYWLGTNTDGIICYNPNTGDKVVYDKANSGIGSNTMVCSLAARDGSVWFGSYEGGLIQIKDGKVTNYRTSGSSDALANNNIWAIYEDQWGYIWIGTLGSGIQRIDPKTGKMDEPISTRNSELPSDYISTITRSDKGWMIVSHSLFYSIVNPSNKKITTRNIVDNKEGIGITESSINVMQDSRGLVWQGSTSGATIWDQKTNSVYLLDMRSGLLGSTVNGIVEDESKNMWIVTDHGVSNVIPQKQQDGTWHFLVRSYNQRDGLQDGPYNQRAVCYTPDGKVLVGGQGGLDILNPRKMGKGRFKERPLFSGLKVSGQEISVGEEVDGRVILKEALDSCRKITLRYDDQFTIQLASNSGEIHNRSRFVYKLEGYNDYWIKTEEVYPNITYMSLRPGNYILSVRMLNDDGSIGDEESQLEISIRAPYWRTRWMIALYVVLIAVAVLYWRRWYMRKQEQRLQEEIERIKSKYNYQENHEEN